VSKYRARILRGPGETAIVPRGKGELIKPIRRYRGVDLHDKELYYISHNTHNSRGRRLTTSSSDQPSGLRYITFACCRLAPGEDPLTQKVVTLNIVDQKFSDGSILKTRTYGGKQGDSGGPILIRVDHTGDPLQDFQVIGASSIPNGDKLQAVLYSNPELNAWIDNIIISEALR
jgi:hypothetical protein